MSTQVPAGYQWILDITWVNGVYTQQAAGNKCVVSLITRDSNGYVNNVSKEFQTAANNPADQNISISSVQISTPVFLASTYTLDFKERVNGNIQSNTFMPPLTEITNTLRDMYTAAAASKSQLIRSYSYRGPNTTQWEVATLKYTLIPVTVPQFLPSQPSLPYRITPDTAVGITVLRPVYGSTKPDVSSQWIQCDYRPVLSSVMDTISGEWVFDNGIAAQLVKISGAIDFGQTGQQTVGFGRQKYVDTTELTYSFSPSTPYFVDSRSFNNTPNYANLLYICIANGGTAATMNLVVAGTQSQATFQVEIYLLEDPSLNPDGAVIAVIEEEMDAIQEEVKAIEDNVAEVIVEQINTSSSLFDQVGNAFKAIDSYLTFPSAQAVTADKELLAQIAVVDSAINIDHSSFDNFLKQVDAEDRNFINDYFNEQSSFLDIPSDRWLSIIGKPHFQQAYRDKFGIEWTDSGILDVGTPGTKHQTRTEYSHNDFLLAGLAGVGWLPKEAIDYYVDSLTMTPHLEAELGKDSSENARYVAANTILFQELHQRFNPHLVDIYRGVADRAGPYSDKLHAIIHQKITPPPLTEAERQLLQQQKIMRQRWESEVASNYQSADQILKDVVGMMYYAAKSYQTGVQSTVNPVVGKVFGDEAQAMVEQNVFLNNIAPALPFLVAAAPIVVPYIAGSMAGTTTALGTAGSSALTTAGGAASTATGALTGPAGMIAQHMGKDKLVEAFTSVLAGGSEAVPSIEITLKSAADKAVLSEATQFFEAIAAGKKDFIQNTDRDLNNFFTIIAALSGQSYSPKAFNALTPDVQNLVSAAVQGVASTGQSRSLSQMANLGFQLMADKRVAAVAGLLAPVLKSGAEHAISALYPTIDQSLVGDKIPYALRSETIKANADLAAQYVAQEMVKSSYGSYDQLKQYLLSGGDKSQIAASDRLVQPMAPLLPTVETKLANLSPEDPTLELIVPEIRAIAKFEDTIEKIKEAIEKKIDEKSYRWVLGQPQSAAQREDHQRVFWDSVTEITQELLRDSYQRSTEMTEQEARPPHGSKRSLIYAQERRRQIPLRGMLGKRSKCCNAQPFTADWYHCRYLEELEEEKKKAHYLKELKRRRII